MNALACVTRTMRMGMADLGKAARNAGITGRREIIKPSRKIRSTGHDIERRTINEAQIPGIKMGRDKPFLDSLNMHQAFVHRYLFGFTKNQHAVIEEFKIEMHEIADFDFALSAVI